MNILPKLCNIGVFREPTVNDLHIENNLNPMRVCPEEEKYDIESNVDERINRISDVESDNLIIVQHYCGCNSKLLLKYILIVIASLSVIAIIHYIDYAIYK